MARSIKPKQNGVAKVPVILQLEMLECGAACLAMILAYYKKWVPLEQVRADCGINRNGSIASNIIKAANNYGLKYRAFKMEPEDIKKQGSFPCLIHWGFNHFVVLDGFKGKFAIINDPARGRVKVFLDEFNREFTGIVIFFEPGPSFEQSGQKSNYLHYFRKAITDYRAESFIISIISVIVGLLSIVFLFFDRIFIDNILNPAISERFEPLLMVFLVVIIFNTVAHCFINSFTKITQNKIETINSTNYFWKVLHLPMRFFEQRMSDEIAQRLSSNKSIASMIVDIIIPVIASFILLIVYTVLLYFQDTILPILGIAAMIVNVLLALYSKNIRENFIRIEQRDESNLQSYTLSGTHMIEGIKAAGAETGFVTKWKALQATVINNQSAQMKKLRFVSLIPEIIRVILNLLILCIGVFYIINEPSNDVNLGYIFLVQGLMQLFFEPISNVIKFRSTYQNMSHQIDKIDDVTNYQDDASFFNDTDISGNSLLSGQISIDNVTFGYSDLDQPVLANFSLSADAGSKIAICGTSGSGKSTVTKLIANLYKPWEGSVTFDGLSHSQINRDVFYQMVSVVEQDVSLLDGTIADNIKMWDEGITDGQMVAAAKDACIHEEIMMMRGGYQHVVTQGGKDLSGGQKQRIEIARALVKNPKICILDEATSSLDALTENNIIKSINKLGITCIVIAHRLSTIKNCDEIIVLDHGQIVERGTHASLLEQNGHYAHLVKNG